MTDQLISAGDNDALVQSHGSIRIAIYQKIYFPRHPLVFSKSDYALTYLFVVYFDHFYRQTLFFQGAIVQFCNLVVITPNNSHSVFVRLHHNLIGFRVGLATDCTETLCHKGSVVEGIVVQLDFPSILPALFFVFGGVLLDDFDLFVRLRRGVGHRGRQSKGTLRSRWPYGSAGCRKRAKLTCGGSRTDRRRRETHGFVDANAREHRKRQQNGHPQIDFQERYRWKHCSINIRAMDIKGLVELFRIEFLCYRNECNRRK